MKFNFNANKKEASFEADVERLIEKGIDEHVKRPERKTRYQIRQEEKRKNEELKKKHFIHRRIKLLDIMSKGIGISMIYQVVEHSF